MKIFITGATGYIGSVLRDRLIEDGNSVHAIYRPSSNKDIDFSRPGVRYFKGDLLDVSSLRRAMKGCEQVYHVAAYARVWSPDPARFYDVNVVGTRNILTLAKELNIKKVVVTSTGATIRRRNKSEPADETDRKEQFGTEYGRTKFLAEKEARKFTQKGLPTVIVNPPRVYGPGLLSESNAVTKIIKWYLEGKWRILPGDGSYTGNYVFVNDVAEGHRKAMAHGRPGEQYILGGDNLSFDELLRLVAGAAGKNHRLWTIPRPLIHSFAKFELWKANRIGGAPLITPQWVENYLQHSALTSRKAISELGYSITPPETAVKLTVDWLNSRS